MSPLVTSFSDLVENMHFFLPARYNPPVDFPLLTPVTCSYGPCRCIPDPEYRVPLHPNDFTDLVTLFYIMGCPTKLDFFSSCSRANSFVCGNGNLKVFPPYVKERHYGREGLLILLKEVKSEFVSLSRLYKYFPKHSPRGRCLFIVEGTLSRRPPFSSSSNRLFPSTWRTRLLSRPVTPPPPLTKGPKTPRLSLFKPWHNGFFLPASRQFRRFSLPWGRIAPSCRWMEESPRFSCCGVPFFLSGTRFFFFF